MSDSWKNKLFFGDNLEILRNHVATESVDLVYLDPPFNSKADYNVLFKTTSGETSAAQATAFKDTWSWDAEAAAAYHELMTNNAVPQPLKRLMEALKVFLTGDTGNKGNSLMAYLTMMALRLVELHRVLKPTGSLYLHCDPTASHYIKLVLDATFGFQGFRTEIIWQRTSSHGNVSRAYGDATDNIFYYSKGPDFTWNQVYIPYSDKHITTKFASVDEHGRKYTTSDLRNPGVRPNLRYEFTARNGITYQPHPNGWAISKEKMEENDRKGLLYYPSSPNGRLRLKRYLDEAQGEKVQNLWDDISPINSQAQERLGYPTQKPESLLARIISASSNEDDVVLDPFCGCGTTIAVAERMNRR